MAARSLLTDIDSGEKSVIADSYGEKSYQVAATGRFRWTANDPGCIVIQRPGPGNATLPFVHQAYSGDTDAFTAPKAPGKIKVTLLDSTESCDLILRDAKDGGNVDIGTILKDGGPILLDPNQRSQVYLPSPSCTVRISIQ